MYNFLSLTQAQVVMRVVDPKIAYQMLHREQAQPLAPPASAASGPPPSMQLPQQFSGPPPQLPPQFSMPPPAVSNQFQMRPPMVPQGQFHGFPPSMNMPPPLMQQGGFGQPQNSPISLGGSGGPPKQVRWKCIRLETKLEDNFQPFRRYS